MDDITLHEICSIVCLRDKGASVTVCSELTDAIDPAIQPAEESPSLKNFIAVAGRNPACLAGTHFVDYNVSHYYSSRCVVAHKPRLPHRTAWDRSVPSGIQCVTHEKDRKLYSIPFSRGMHVGTALDECDRILGTLQHAVNYINQHMTLFGAKRALYRRKVVRQLAKTEKSRTRAVNLVTLAVCHLDRFIKTYAMEESSFAWMQQSAFGNITNEVSLRMIHNALVDWAMVATTSSCPDATPFGTCESDSLFKPFAWDEIVQHLRRLNIVLSDFIASNHNAITRNDVQIDKKDQTELENFVAETSVLKHFIAPSVDNVTYICASKNSFLR